MLAWLTSHNVIQCIHHHFLFLWLLFISSQMDVVFVVWFLFGFTLFYFDIIHLRLFNCQIRIFISISYSNLVNMCFTTGYAIWNECFPPQAAFIIKSNVSTQLDDTSNNKSDKVKPSCLELHRGCFSNNLYLFCVCICVCTSVGKWFS